MGWFDRLFIVVVFLSVIIAGCVVFHHIGVRLGAPLDDILTIVYVRYPTGYGICMFVGGMAAFATIQRLLR